VPATIDAFSIFKIRLIRLIIAGTTEFYESRSGFLHYSTEECGRDVYDPTMAIVEDELQQQRPLMGRKQAVWAVVLTSSACIVLFAFGGYLFWQCCSSSSGTENENWQLSMALVASTSSQALSCAFLNLPLLQDCFLPQSTSSTAVVRKFSIHCLRAAGVALSLTSLALVLVSLSPFSRIAILVGASILTLSCVSLMITFWPIMLLPEQYPRDATTTTTTTTAPPDEEEVYHLMMPAEGDYDHEQQQQTPLLRANNITDAADTTTTTTSTGAIVPRRRGARRLFQVARPQLLYLYAGFIALLIRLPFSLAIPHFVSTTLSALAHANYTRARHEIALLLVLGSVDAILDFWCVFLFGTANIRIVRGLRVHLFRRMIRQEVAFFDQTPSGELASRLNSDCSEMAQDLTWFFRMSIESVVRIVGITSYMMIRSPILGGFTLTVVPLVGVINKFYGDWLSRNARQVQDALAEANVVAQEVLANIRTVIAFAAEGRECQRYESKVERQFQLNLRQLIMSGM
jgi:hypothetical protein